MDPDNEIEIMPVDKQDDLEIGTIDTQNSAPHVEVHNVSVNEHVKSMIYGGLDGVVSVFVAVASVAGSTSSYGTALIIGSAALISGCVSMGVGDYLSTSAEVDYAKNERKREEWECENFLEGEIDEMVELWVAKGYTEPTARRLMEIFAKYRRPFVDLMMVDELGISPTQEDDVPWKAGLVNFGSFIIFGILPLIGYIFFAVAHNPHTTKIQAFVVSIVVTIIALATLGVIKGRMTGTHWFKSAVLTTIFGLAGAVAGGVVAYLLGLKYGGV